MRYRDPNIYISFPIVKISVVVTLIRIFLLFMIFIPLSLDELFPVKHQPFVRSLFVLPIIALFVFIHLKSNYKQVGYLDFYDDFFQISISETIFRSSEATKLNIKYLGYKGEVYLMDKTRLFSFATKDGINEILLEINNKRVDYKFLSMDKGDLNSIIHFKSKFKGKMVIDISE